MPSLKATPPHHNLRGARAGESQASELPLSVSRPEGRR